MKKIEQYQMVKTFFKGRILIDEPLNRHTSYRIGGPADFYVFPRNLEDLIGLVDLCSREDIERFVIGNGSNLLVNDDGFRGVVIDLSETFNHCHSKGNEVMVGAGTHLRDLLKYCTQRGLSGMESLVGIPGQVGGAIRLNAGAWGGEIGDHLQHLRWLDRSGTLEKWTREQLAPGYRTTLMPAEGIVVEVQFALDEGNPMEMESVQNSYLKDRKAKQPLSLPSAGSVFKRPPGDYAGRLIEEAGCKGLRIGDAMVSKKHANFIVNCHLASAQDVLRLADEVRERVLRNFGVELEMEIVLVGFGRNG